MPKKVKIYVRLFDFKITDQHIEYGSDSDDNKDKPYRETVINMFGMNEKGKTFCLNVLDFKPFFYVKVPHFWGPPQISEFENKLKQELSYSGKDVYSVKKIMKKKLYGFDNHRLHKFLKITFNNNQVFLKARRLWYTDEDDFTKRKLRKDGFKNTILYEAKLPPLLRMFHIKDISPSGWISFYRHNIDQDMDTGSMRTDYEYWISYKNLKAEREKEDTIPLKVCSYDIEASSSHGDFPLAKKTYLKLCREIVNYWRKHKDSLKKEMFEYQQEIFKRLVFTAFGYDNMEDISDLYFKRESRYDYIKSLDNVKNRLNYILKTPIWKFIKMRNKKQKSKQQKSKQNKEEDIDSFDEEEDMESSIRDIKDFEEEEKKEAEEDVFGVRPKIKKIWFKEKQVYQGDIINLLFSKEEVSMVADMLEEIFLQEVRKKDPSLPPVQGDKVTFIGSTFQRLNETSQYKNHMIVLNSCSPCSDVPNSEIECYNTEREVLLAWTEMIKREDPDIIIGYNIFGFDYKFMIERSQELKCYSDFMKLGRNIDEESKLIKTSLKIASGTHELTYVDMVGRLQLDLYNYFRREVNLPSYKLDYVASHFIGDMCKKMVLIDDKTKVYSKNLTGLLNGHYICFEILGHSSDMFKDGKKFIVRDVNKEEGSFVIDENIVEELEGKKIRWCLAKDDVSPQDIFRLTNEGPDERAIIAKYCFQDCNLVHNLMRKNDIFTGISEIANICYVPINFIIMRGQGIKLLSFIAKKASEKDTLMPVLDVEKGDSSYEGAICLKPYCGLYIDNPIAVVDYSSLYPSCMISENISHDSKVWTKEYDLDGVLIKETGEKNFNGDYIYDNLDGYKYVDVTYDRYEWRRKGKGRAQEKIKVGTKVCRFAQFPNNEKAIMPSVLKELLTSRKNTRSYIKYKTITLKSGEKYSGLYNKDAGVILINNKKDKININPEDIESIEDTYDDVMKNVYDKRQLGLKITANSLYGQTGAKTSSFYEMDIAASTTATGRKLLIYAKKIIEGLYGDKVCETKYGKIKSNAKVVYGDTDSCFMAFNVTELDGTKIRGKKALDITIQLAIEAGETATKFLKAPHDLEYEKTFDPFLLLSKKRYVGMLYETDINKCKRKSMGIVLKRRDNAPIVKDIYGGIIDIIMKEQNIEKAVEFTKNFLNDIIAEKFPLEKLIITKSLREFYKAPESIAHKVLADRMGKRDPGNKPSTGSRIPFVYIKTKKKVKLQGDKVEHPDFIKKNNLKPDYKFYITNQIMKPVTQIYSLVLEDLVEFKKKLPGFQRKVRALKRKWKDNEKKCLEYEMKERNAHVKELIFNNALIRYNNKINSQTSLSSFFSK